LPILESERVSVEIKHALHEKILHLFTKVVVGFRDMDLALKTKVTQIEQLEQMVHRQRDHINTCIARIESSHRTFGARNETLGELEQRTSDVVRELSREQHRLDALRRAEQQAAELQVCLRERQIYIQERELHLANRAQRLNDEKVSVLAIEAATKEKQREQQKTQTTLRAKEQQLDAREAALLPKEQQLDARDAALLPKEQQLTRREAAVREREEKMTKIGESINDFVFVNPVTSRSCSYIAAYAVAMSLPVSMPLVAVPVAIYALWEFGSLVADVGSDVLGTRKITAPPLTQVLARAYETHLSSN
ncbi:MAG: hypothetical protein KDK65_02030, partial [Chlamydiia bacterium]|nr:hypothetical protein [Chlamydiia bacterium]